MSRLPMIFIHRDRAIEAHAEVRYLLSPQRDRFQRAEHLRRQLDLLCTAYVAVGATSRERAALARKCAALAMRMETVMFGARREQR